GRRRAAGVSARPVATTVSALAAGQVRVLAIGVMLTLHGKVTLGTFLAFAAYVANLVGPTRLLSGLMINAQMARAGVERVYELIESQPAVRDAPGAVPVPDGPLEVRLTDVHFGYTRSEPVPDGVSLPRRPRE